MEDTKPEVAAVPQITIDPAKLQVVDIKTIRLNTWNPKDKDTKESVHVKESIRVNGLMGFIVVRDNPVGEVRWEVIDGEQRFSACSELEFTKMLIYNEGVVSDQRAQELTLWWQAQVPFNELSLAKMVSKMVEQYGDIHTYFTEKQVAEMQQLAQFNFNQYQKAPTMPPPPTAELMKNFMVQVTTSQYDIIAKALDKARTASGEEIADSKALEFVCAEYLLAPPGTVAEEPPQAN